MIVRRARILGLIQIFVSVPPDFFLMIIINYLNVKNASINAVNAYTMMVLQIAAQIVADCV